jgi:VWFA-related protein
MHHRMGFCLRILLGLQFLVFAQLFPAASTAQSGTTPASAAQSVTRAIDLDVTVTDKLGKPVAGLGQSDFTLLDNNQPIKIASFRAIDRSGLAADADPLIEAIVVLDTINLEANEVSMERAGLATYLRQNGGHLPIPVTILMVGNKGVVAQLLPSIDGNALATQVDNMKTQLRTVTDDAGQVGQNERFMVSLNLLTIIARQSKSIPARKLMIWIGTGWPLLYEQNQDMSYKGAEQTFNRIVALSTALREAKMTLDSVSIGSQDADTNLYQNYLKGVKSLKKAAYSNLSEKVLALQSGGFIFGPDNNLAVQLDNCVSKASAYYELSFEPAKAGGPDEYHDLKIQIGKPGLAAHTNTGYYNQP